MVGVQVRAGVPAVEVGVPLRAGVSVGVLVVTGGVPVLVAAAGVLVPVLVDVFVRPGTDVQVGVGVRVPVRDAVGVARPQGLSSSVLPVTVPGVAWVRPPYTRTLPSLSVVWAIPMRGVASGGPALQV